MAMQSVLDEVDADFNIHTSYHTDFFLLRTKVLVNGENATISSVKEGSYDEPIMSFCHGGSTISTKLWSIANTISPILHKCGIYHVDTFFYEKSPLFHVRFSSESCLKSFLLEIGDVIHAIELEVRSVISPCLKSTRSHETESPQQLAIEIQPDLFLVSPNQQETKGAELHLVTEENYSTCVTHWKESKLFDFEYLYKSEEKAAQYTSAIPDVSEVDSTPLDLSDLFDVISELSPIATNWKSVGAALQLKFDILKSANTRCSGNPHTYLSGMVKEWLKRNYNVEKYGEPTWQRLVEVVVHPAGGANPELATDIARRHTAGVTKQISPTLLGDTVTHTPPSITPLVPDGGVESLGGSQQEERFGGYNCDFVEPPPSAFQTECPICMLVLRDPYQCECCGKSFCHSCCEQIQAERKPCPTCKGANFKVFQDNGLKHSLNQLHVYCTYSKDGCKWRGELGELDHHLKEAIHSNIHVPPRITTHPQELKDVVPGKSVTFTVQATGTEPLNYQWEHKAGDWNERWQLCDVERFPGANSSILIIPSVRKSNEGSYRCIVSNCAGIETSEYATLTFPESPKITAHPQELKCTISDKPVSFTVKATGTEPLRYQWQWKPVVEGVSIGEWQNLSSGGPVQGADTPTLMFTSIEDCSEGLYRCVVTNVVGEEISEYTDYIIGKITKLHVLVNELRTVSQWHLLGIYLGLHPSALNAIKKDCTDTKECCTHMLIEWQKCVIPTWTAVFKALVGIGRERLASHLAAKYGVPLPETVNNKPLEELHIVEAKQKPAAGSEIHFRRDEFQRLGRRLSEIEQLLKASRESKVPLNEDVNDLVSELTKLGNEVQKFAQERDRTESELKRKEHDIQLLSDMKKDLVHSAKECQLLQEKCQLFQEICQDKKVVIKRLEEQLKMKEHQLQCAQQEAQAVKDKLSKLQAELEQKHEEVKNLQKEKEELTKLYCAEKEEAMNLLQITLSNRNEMEQQFLATEEELQYKSQMIAASNSHISQLTEEVEALSSSLQEKEAAVAQLESELQSYQKPASNPNHLSAVNALTTEIVELTQKLQEAEYQKQQASLERDGAIQETKEKMFEKHSQLGPIQGVEVIGVTEFTVPTQGGCFEWKGYGLKLHVPEESLPSGMEEARVNIRASLSGQFQLPEDSDLLSPVFWISAPCKFIKAVTLEIQHCALREDERVLSYLNFVSAKCLQSNLPYRFKHLDGGVFTKHSYYGSIQLTHFCGMGVTGSKDTPRLYCAHLYHTMKHLHDWRFYLAITRDLEAQITAVEKYYSDLAKQNRLTIKRDRLTKVGFEGSAITLKIPEDEEIKEGWKITPITYPMIARMEADEFKKGQSIPDCELMMEWKRKDDTPVRLTYKVVLNGASAPGNYLFLVLDPAEAATNQVQDSASNSGSKEHPTIPGKPELKDLTCALNNMADQWMTLGVQLDIPKPKLNSIEVKYRNDPRRCLLEMLEEWLQWQVKPPPNWADIVNAVESLGDNQLGKELREKYMT